MSSPDPERAALARLAELQGALRAEERRSGTISTLRGVTFLVALGVAGVRLVRPLPSWAWAIAAVAAAAFVVLVVVHAQLVTKMAGIELRVRLVERARKRIAGDIAGFPE